MFPQSWSLVSGLLCHREGELSNPSPEAALPCMKDENHTPSVFSEKQTGLGPCPSSNVCFSVFNWWLFIGFKDVWIMNSGPFTGETNASPSSLGVRQNSFHGNSCEGLQYSPELPPLLNQEVEACNLSGSRGNCGLFLSTDPTVKGAHRPQTRALLLVLPRFRVGHCRQSYLQYLLAYPVKNMQSMGWTPFQGI